MCSIIVAGAYRSPSFSILTLSCLWRSLMGFPKRGQTAPARSGSNAGKLYDRFSPIAIVPIEGFSATTSAYPTLFFRVPSLPANSSLPVKFALLDGNKTVYQTKFPFTGIRRTIGVELPSTGELQPLEIDRGYRWMSSLQSGNTSASAVDLDAVAKDSIDP